MAQIVDLPQLLEVLVMPPVVETPNITWSDKAFDIMSISLNFHNTIIKIKKKTELTPLAALAKENMLESTGAQRLPCPVIHL